MKAAVAAALLAFIPASTSLLERVATRGRGARGREVTLIGTLTITGEPQAGEARLVLKMPLQCRLERDDGTKLLVRGTADRPNAIEEGPSGALLTLVRLACPFVAYRGLNLPSATQLLQGVAQQNGVDLAGASGLSRLEDRVVYVLGAAPRDTSRPQLWIYKDSNAPARLITQGGADLRLLEYGSPAAADWFPRVIELWEGGKRSVRFDVLETKGAKLPTAEEEAEDNGGE
jgi:hypothetical protein